MVNTDNIRHTAWNECADLGDFGMSEAKQIIACPVCDTLYAIDDEIAAVPTNCRRCGHRLTYGERAAIAGVVGMAFASATLMLVALFVPFLELSNGGRTISTSLVHVVAGFSRGIMVPLGFAVLGFIILLPLLRFLLLIFSLGPVAFHKSALPGAAIALRIAIALKPWAMAEVFMVGVAVALVKLSDLAFTDVGVGFWILAVAVLITAYQETFMCRHTLWTELNRAQQ